MAETIALNIDKLPLLQYLKEPALFLTDLYTKYPSGGSFGWFLWVNEKRTFYYWDIDTEDWRPISKSSLYELLGIDESLLVEGDVPVWNAEAKKFEVINLSIWGTEEY